MASYCLRFWGFVVSTLLFCAVCSVTDRAHGSERSDDPVSNVKDLATSKIDKNITRSLQRFEVNNGQFQDNVRFLSRYGTQTVWFADDEVVYEFRSPSKSRKEILDESVLLGDDTESPVRHRDVVRISFVGANSDLDVVGEDALPHRTNYLIGKDRSKWTTDVPSYEAIVYKNVYDGIDLRYYYRNGVLEYDFVVSPGADFEQVRIEVSGADELSLDERGNLIIPYANGRILERAPLIFQNLPSGRETVDGEFVLLDSNVFGFSLSEGYDKSIALVIDPQVYYSSYLGGSGKDVPWGVAVDDCYNLYVTGVTASTDFPEKGNHDSLIDRASEDIFVSKFNTRDGAANSLVYSTYVGGDGVDQSWDIAVNNLGEAYVSGFSGSSDFPTNSGDFQPSRDGSFNGVVFGLNGDGDSLVYSTYFGGGAYVDCNCIGLDDSGYIYTGGWMRYASIPTTSNAFEPDTIQADWIGFLSKLDPSESSTSQLKYSTFVPGDNGDTLPSGAPFQSYLEVHDLYVESSNTCYVTGFVQGGHLPIKPSNAYRTSNLPHSTWDSFVMKFDLESSGESSLVYSTFAGATSGRTLEGNFVTVDDSSRPIIVGVTQCDTIFHLGDDTTQYSTLKSNAYDTTFAEQTTAFIMELSSDFESAGYLSYLGGPDTSISDSAELALGVTTGPSGDVYITGATPSSNFETTTGAYDETHNGDYDAFLVRLDLTETPSSQLVYSTFFGGTGRDHGGHGIALVDDTAIYLVGPTGSSDFVVTSDNAYQTVDSGGGDVWVMRFTMTDYAWSFPGQMGDVNKDGVVDYADLKAMIDYIFASAPLACFDAGDLDNDGDIDTADVSALGGHLANCTTPSGTPKCLVLQ